MIGPLSAQRQGPINYKDMAHNQSSALSTHHHHHQRHIHLCHLSMFCRSFKIHSPHQSSLGSTLHLPCTHAKYVYSLSFKHKVEHLECNRKITPNLWIWDIEWIEDWKHEIPVKIGASRRTIIAQKSVFFIAFLSLTMAKLQFIIHQMRYCNCGDTWRAGMESEAYKKKKHGMFGWLRETPSLWFLHASRFYPYYIFRFSNIFICLLNHLKQIHMISYKVYTLIAPPSCTNNMLSPQKI